MPYLPMVELVKYLGAPSTESSEIEASRGLGFKLIIELIITVRRWEWLDNRAEYWIQGCRVKRLPRTWIYRREHR